VAAAKKTAAKKAPAKKAPDQEPEVTEEPQSAPVTVMEGEEYENGFLGVSGDDEDYSIAAEVKRLSED
jgi:hypothetical protein